MIKLLPEEITDYNYEKQKIYKQMQSCIKSNKKIPYRLEKRLKEINMILEKVENDFLLIEALKKIRKG